MQTQNVQHSYDIRYLISNSCAVRRATCVCVSEPVEPNHNKFSSKPLSLRLSCCTYAPFAQLPNTMWFNVCPNNSTMSFPRRKITHSSRFLVCTRTARLNICCPRRMAIGVKSIENEPIICLIGGDGNARRDKRYFIQIALRKYRAISHRCFYRAIRSTRLWPASSHFLHSAAVPQPSGAAMLECVHCIYHQIGAL